MPIRRKTRKRGGTKPPSGNAPPPPYNELPPSYNTLSSSVSSSIVTSSKPLPTMTPIASTAASNLPPEFNQLFMVSTSPPAYTPESRVIETQTNAPSKPNSRVIETQTNRPSVSNMSVQTNNTNRNITEMTEEQILKQYTSVYETISSKADAVESTALFKEHLQKIKNPFAIYLVAHMDSNSDNYSIRKSATLYTCVITRNSVHAFNSTFFGAPIHPSYKYVISNPYAPADAYGNKITVHDIYQFKKPLDSRLIRMFQSISKSPAIGQTNTTVINMPGCQPCTTGSNVQGILVGQFTALYMAL